jgi:hypothetical protein
MIIAIMQPYFFPYIGYFQLMEAVDVFILYDDAKHIEHGWVNRNKILIKDKPVWLTMPVRHESHTLPINQRHYLLSEGVGPIKRKLQAAYGRKNSSAEELTTIDNLLDFEDANVARFNAHSLLKLAHRLGIRCEFAFSSEITGTKGLKGEAKVIEMCRQKGATRYINPIGGSSLYDADAFSAAGIELQFLRTRVEPTSPSVAPSHLSTIHTIMEHGFAGTRAALPIYELLDSSSASKVMT